MAGPGARGRIFIQMWWHMGLLGLAGGAANRAVVFLEALSRIHAKKAKQKWPWEKPLGPGTAPYFVSIAIHLTLAFGTTAVVTQSYDKLDSSIVAFCLGAAAVTVVKKCVQLGDTISRIVGGMITGGLEAANPKNKEGELEE